MLTHSIQNLLLLNNVRVEVVFENSPNFADEEVSAIVRFRHLGELPKKKDTIAESPKDPKIVDGGQNSTEDGWFGKRLSVQLTNTARSLFLEEFENNEKKENPKNKHVNLLSGYIQLSGVFTYDKQVINHDHIQEFRNKSTIAGRIGGLEGLELSKTANQNIFNYLSTGIGNLFSSEIDDLGSQKLNKSELDSFVPFFSTPQSLLFSELNLKPAEVEQFYIKCKLPKGIPPSYRGDSISIAYRLIVGATLDSNIPQPMILRFPLRVSPFFDSDGYQPISNLDRFFLLPQDQIRTEGVYRKDRRKSSFKSIKRFTLSQPGIIENSKKEVLLKRMDHLLQNKEEKENVEETAEYNVKTVRDAITLLSDTLVNKSEVDPAIPRFLQKDNYTFEQQISKIQNQYSISRNGELITVLTFGKPFYKIGEEIKLSFDFTNKNLAVTGVMVVLESLELIKDSVSVDPETTKAYPKKIRYYNQSFSTFKTRILNIDVPIPLEATSQFKTSLFESRWSISLKFILSSSAYLLQVHKDDTGSLYRSADNMNGKEFNCRLPLTVIPSDQDFGGNIV